jgi:spore germination cell wall hydrolase CwlJ-like protein
VLKLIALTKSSRISFTITWPKRDFWTKAGYCLVEYMNNLKAAIVLFACSLSCNAQFDNQVIASVLILEAGGERDSRAMPAVFEVIKNRSKERNLSPYQVVKQNKQFSCCNNRTDSQIISLAKSHPKYRIALEIVTKTTHHAFFVGGANHYYATSIKPPYWAEENKFVIQIGNHRFYKL